MAPIYIYVCFCVSMKVLDLPILQRIDVRLVDEMIKLPNLNEVGLEISSPKLVDHILMGGRLNCAAAKIACNS